MFFCIVCDFVFGLEICQNQFVRGCVCCVVSRILLGLICTVSGRLYLMMRFPDRVSLKRSLVCIRVPMIDEFCRHPIGMQKRRLVRCDQLYDF